MVYPTMPATVIGARIGWTRSSATLRLKVSQLRPLYRGVDPVDRTEYAAGELAQCDLWFPPVKIALGQGPLGQAQLGSPPVLVMTSGFSRFIAALMIPSRMTGDLLAGMWLLLATMFVGVPRTLVWDNESGIGAGRRLTAPAQAFAGTLGNKIMRLRPRDPEGKGMVERANGYLETSFLPGREFTCPQDFNTQLGGWLIQANTRLVRRTGARPVDLLGADRAAMLELPPIAPQLGLTTRVRLPRDYYVRVDANDYSVHPEAIGHLVDVRADLDNVRVRLGSKVVACHQRSWAHRLTITDPAHQHAAVKLREHYRTAAAHPVPDAPVQLRALPDYDDMFGTGPDSDEPTVVAS